MPMIRKKFYVPEEEACRDYNLHLDRMPANIEEELEEDGCL